MPPVNWLRNGGNCARMRNQPTRRQQKPRETRALQIARALQTAQVRGRAVHLNTRMWTKVSGSRSAFILNTLPLPLEGRQALQNNN